MLRAGFVIGDRGLGASGDSHPAWLMAHAAVGPWLVAGASAVGRIHLARGRPRDDAFVIRSAGPWLAVAVADGVGSRPLSRYGATYVAEALSALLLRPLLPPLETGRQAPGSVPTASAPNGLAPPPDAEPAELRAEVLHPVAGLEAWPPEWTGKAHGPADGLLQAASVGWWPPPVPDKPAGEAVRSVQTPPGPAPLPTPTPPDPGAAAVGPEAPAAGATSSAAPAEPDWERALREAFEKAHRGLGEHARGLNLEPADLSCTALALLFNVETGEGAVGQVGDGALLGLTAQGKVEPLVEAPETGDPQATYTLNRPDFEKYLAVRRLRRAPADPWVALYVMTDGLAGDLLYSPPTEALVAWAHQVDQNLRRSPSPAQAAAGMLNWLATYVVRGSWDDRTLVVITRRDRDHGDSQPATEPPQPAGPTEHQ